VNFAREYRERVFAHFLNDYQAGRTPNPDVLCNSEIKFNAFLDHALSLGAERIATGHYAQLKRSGGESQLLKAVDRAKDQTYFLHRLDQRQLDRALFPIGHLTKGAVRAIAREQRIPTYAKRDSTGICFIGERPFRDFLARYLPKMPGPIETPDKVVVGRHQGLAYYTLGQRQGLGIGGKRGTDESAWFVAGKDLARNVLTVVQGHDDPRLHAQRSRSTRCTGLEIVHPFRACELLQRSATAWRMRRADWIVSMTIAGARGSTLPNGRRRPVSIWSYTPARSASAAA